MYHLLNMLRLALTAVIALGMVIIVNVDLGQGYGEPSSQCLSGCRVSSLVESCSLGHINLYRNCHDSIMGRFYMISTFG